MKTSAYLSSITATVASVLHRPACAQDLAQGRAPPAAEQTAPGVTGVEYILVTATKRNENLIDVPISMSVLTETAITSAGIDRASEFLSNIPTVTFIEDNAGEVYVNIRDRKSTRLNSSH